MKIVLLFWGRGMMLVGGSRANTLLGYYNMLEATRTGRRLSPQQIIALDGKSLKPRWIARHDEVGTALLADAKEQYEYVKI